VTKSLKLWGPEEASGTKDIPHRYEKETLFFPQEGFNAFQKTGEGGLGITTS